MGKEIKELNNDILRVTQSVVVHTPRYAKFGGYDGENDIYTMDIAKELYNKGWRKQSEGEWEKRVFIIFDSEKVGYRCSECNTTWDATATYCPECGAKMKGGK